MKAIVIFIGLLFLMGSASAAITAGFIQNPSTSDIGQTVQFTDVSAGVGASPAWNWSFGCNETYGTSTEQNPWFAYSHSGTCTVTLNVTDATGDFGVASIQHSVNYNNAISYHNTFTTTTYAQTFNIVSATTGNAINVVVITDSYGNTVTTSAGTGVIEMPAGPVTVTFTADEYLPTTLSFIVTGPATHSVLMYPTGGGEKLNVLYPHEVRIMTIDHMGHTLSGVFVDAVMVNSTIRDTNWYETLFGVGTNVQPAINSTHMNGTTDSRGYVVMPMIGSGKYQINFLNTSAGINQTEYLHPDQASYYYVLHTTDSADPLNPDDFIFINLSANGTTSASVFLNASFNNSYGDTTNVNFFVNFPNQTTLYSKDYPSIGGSNQSVSVAYSVTNVAGDAYVWGIESFSSRFGWRNMSQGIDLKGTGQILYNPFEYKDRW